MLIFSSLAEGLMHFFQAEQKEQDPNAIVPWDLVEKEGWPIASFKNEMAELSRFLVARACKLQVRRNGHAEVIGVYGAVVTRICVKEEWGAPTHITVQYLSGVISTEGERELASYSRMRLICVLSLDE